MAFQEGAPSRMDKPRRQSEGEFAVVCQQAVLEKLCAEVRLHALPGQLSSV